MRYDVLLLDADMTIYDFHAAEHEALRSVLEYLHITDPQAPEIYSKINAQCWADLEKGLITQDELRVRRFRELLEYYQISGDVGDVPQLYVEALSHQSQLLPGALEAVQALARLAPIAIVTNGIPYVQHGRFDGSEARKYVQELVISGEEGFFKPDPRLIEVALRRMGTTRERALMVGDSLGSDILGAQRAGVDACWLNPQGKGCTLEREPKYTVKNLMEVCDILCGENEAVWTDLSYVLPDAQHMAERLHVSEDDFDDFAAIHARCAQIASPKFVFREAPVQLLENDDVRIGDQTFHSRVLHVNMQGVQSAYAYVATCGRELYELALSCADPLERYWVDSISEQLLRSVGVSAHARLKEMAHRDRLFAMNPGSLPDWPVAQQRPLFDLIGNVYEKVGVELTDTFLMLPIKSNSGLYYASETDFVNCEFCARGECPSRRAKFNAQKFAEKYGL